MDAARYVAGTRAAAASTEADDGFPLAQLQDAILRHWGFASLRPLQEAAMRTILAGRDSLLVLPTGGGKSLCYQAPAVLRGDTTVVISPLISLMKDQVDALVANGVAAVQLNSAMTPDELRTAEQAVVSGAARLVFASPERMATPSFRRLVAQIGVRTFAIDEAHCISHWGHDFRPDYRQLSQLKELFPHASVHAFTATATEQVRRDIMRQLALRDAEVLVGNFDRPNLTYRVEYRQDLMAQTLTCVERRRGEAGIIYCIRRRDVDNLTADLQNAGFHALPYHAGLDPGTRKATQDAFAEEKCDLVVATVAFGMGIDRSNVRFVLHTGMPKSIEHYQQETGRAGRDGLEAECVLLYSGADAMLWRSLIDKSASESETPVDPQWLRSALKHVGDMESFCRSIVCRHRALVEYFDQTYDNENCQACDVCLDDPIPVADAQTVAKKILSCVARVKETFGVNHVIGVLRGQKTANILQRGHDQLSTYGLLADRSRGDVRDWIEQLIAQDALVRERVPKGNDEIPILKLNAASWEVMRDQRSVKLCQRQSAPLADDRASSGAADGGTAKRSRADVISWEGVDRELFDSLRELRRALAGERGVPPFVVFSDATLRELARIRPSTLERMRVVYGIGEAKLRDFGAAFLEVVCEQCGRRGLSVDNLPGADPRLDTTLGSYAPGHHAPGFYGADERSSARSSVRTSRAPNPIKAKAMELFREQASIEDVMHQTGRTRGTVGDYLAEYVRDERPASIAPWVHDDIYRQIAAAAEREGTERLKPIFLALGEQVSYDQIRIVLAYLANADGSRLG